MSSPDVCIWYLVSDSYYISTNVLFQVDIWSLGITLIEFAQMEPPNHEMSPMRVLLKIQKSDPPKLDQPSKWSRDFNEFISKCLTKDPSQRPTADDLLKVANLSFRCEFFSFWYAVFELLNYRKSLCLYIVIWAKLKYPYSYQKHIFFCAQYRYTNSNVIIM